jgi:hypothetical protein
MNGEQRRDEGALRGAARHPAEDEENQQHVRHVQSDVRDVIAVGPLTVDRRVEHQREPRQGDPIGVIELGKGPFQAGEFQSVQHIAIPLHVGGIVQDDEIEAADLSVDSQGQHDQQQTEHEAAAHEGLAASHGRVRGRHDRRGRLLAGPISVRQLCASGLAFAGETRWQSQAGT